MTHLHIPDGILPGAVWLPGMLLMVLMLGVSLRRLRSLDRVRNIPLLGAVSACMLVVMSLPEIVLPYHINLSVVAGILLGPALGFLAAFMANLMLALLGHGGLTVLGLNSLLLGSEAVLGHAIFSVLQKRLSVFWSAAAATLITLLLTTAVLIGIVAIARIDPDILMHDHHDLQPADHRHTVTRFAVMVMALGSVGWILESAISGAVLRFIAQVKPDLLGHTLHGGPAGREQGVRHD